jgi:hypothetical protein
MMMMDGKRHLDDDSGSMTMISLNLKTTTTTP